MYKKIGPDNLPTYLIDLPQKTKDWSVRFDVSAGYLSAPDGQRELPHLLEHYLVKCLRVAGLDCWATTDVDTVSFYLAATEKTIVKRLQTFMTILLNNQLNDEKTYLIEERIWRNEFLGTLDDPKTLSCRLCVNNLVSKTVYATSLSDMSLEQLKKYYRKTFLESKMELFLGSYRVKKLLADEIVSLISSHGVRMPQQIRLDKVHYGSKRIVDYTFSTNRTHVCLTWPAPAHIGDPVEQIAMLLIADRLCDSPDGLLWRALQDETGLVYDIDYYVDSYNTFGYFSIQIGVLRGNEDKCIGIILDQVNKLASATYAETALRKIIKEERMRDKALWEKNPSRFKWVISDLRNQGSVNNLDDWRTIYKSINPGYLASIIKKYLTNNVLQIIRAGRGMPLPGIRSERAGV